MSYGIFNGFVLDFAIFLVFYVECFMFKSSHKKHKIAKWLKHTWSIIIFQVGIQNL